MKPGPGNIVFRVHAIQRMFQRRISEEDVRYVLDAGEVIEEYPGDVPYPSKLILGERDQRYFHVVVAENKASREMIVITVYEPNLGLWESGFRRRKK